jgi:dTDP-4-amino-4,6-dideoxygalactose transaminase
MDKLIPFNVPYVPEASKRYVLEALGSSHQQGDGPFTAKASKLVSDLVGGGHVLLTPSCTHALEMASMLANIGPGDEVILPSFTFTSAATAITKFGATPVFVDIEMETKGIDVNQARDAISPRTKAISWVNYAGVAPDIEGLQNLAKEFNLILIEDNAHGLGGSYKGKPLGSFGDFATQSFHATKNIQCGEGGALVINNPNFIERAEIIREKGTDRSKYIKGEIQRYQWVDQGSSYLIAETLAAILVGQLEEFSRIQDLRKAIWQTFYTCLTEKDFQCDSYISKLLLSAQEVSHIFYVEVPNPVERDFVRKLMRNSGFEISTHYEPLNLSLHGKRIGVSTSACEFSKQFSQSVLRFPLYPGLDIAQADQIASEFVKIMQNRSSTK